jgi:hypothetical protein
MIAFSSLVAFDLTAGGTKKHIKIVEVLKAWEVAA